jgi:hypothetical protein
LRAGSAGAAALVLIAAIVADSTPLSAHRLDECLQAARIAIEPDRVELDLSLTPGVDVIDSIAGEIDRNGDGLLATAEQAAFASRVLGAVTLVHDDHPLKLTLRTTTFPDVNALRGGEGTIRIRAVASVSALAGASHRLSFRNGFRPDVSVYLANALVPESNRVAVIAQHHAGDQRDLTIDYVVSEVATITQSVWLLSGVVLGLITLLAVPSTRRARVRRARAPRPGTHVANSTGPWDLTPSRQVAKQALAADWARGAGRPTARRVRMQTSLEGDRVCIRTLRAIGAAVGGNPPRTDHC